MARAMRQSVSSIHLSIRSRASFTRWTHPNRGNRALRDLLEARFAILMLKLLGKRAATLDPGHERQTSRIQRIAETPDSLRRNKADLERQIAADSRSFILGWSQRGDDLPRFEQRFRGPLNQNTIRERVTRINRSLHRP